MKFLLLKSSQNRVFVTNQKVKREELRLLKSKRLLEESRQSENLTWLKKLERVEEILAKINIRSDSINKKSRRKISNKSRLNWLNNPNANGEENVNDNDSDDDDDDAVNGDGTKNRSNSKLVVKHAVVNDIIHGMKSYTSLVGHANDKNTNDLNLIRNRTTTSPTSKLPYLVKPNKSLVGDTLAYRNEFENILIESKSIRRSQQPTSSIQDTIALDRLKTVDRSKDLWFYEMRNIRYGVMSSRKRNYLKNKYGN